MQLRILNTNIESDGALYCLNDIHRASGGGEQARPSRWLALVSTKSFIDYVISSDVKTSDEHSSGFEGSVNAHIMVKSGPLAQGGGTFVSKKLMYAYATWISPQFFSHVIETFDRVQMEQVAKLQCASDAYAAIAVSSSDLLISDAALVLHVPRDKFFTMLSSHFGWIYKRGSRWWPKQKAVEQGFVARRRHDFSDSGGSKSSYQTVLTERGLVHVQQGLLPS